MKPWIDVDVKETSRMVVVSYYGIEFGSFSCIFAIVPLLFGMLWPRIKLYYRQAYVWIFFMWNYLIFSMRPVTLCVLFREADVVWTLIHDEMFMRKTSLFDVWDWTGWNVPLGVHLDSIASLVWQYESNVHTVLRPNCLFFLLLFQLCSS